MNPTQLERLRELHLTHLRLLKSHERLDALLQETAAKDLSYADFLDQVLSEEVTAKAAQNITMRTSLARFPFVKSLDAFDFACQPSLDKKQIQQVATCVHPAVHGRRGRRGANEGEADHRNGERLAGSGQDRHARHYRGSGQSAEALTSVSGACRTGLTSHFNISTLPVSDIRR